MTESTPQVRYTKQCEYPVAGRQCRCWGTQQVNEIWYCDTHAEKAKREAAALKPK